MPVAPCHLCGTTSELKNSHIVPAFVFRWLRETSGNGHLRSSQTPNVRIQDGPKERWLCAACEANFNRSETAFATQIFHPYLKASGNQLKYGSWLLHFCASVSWRTLHYHTLHNYTEEFPPHLEKAIQQAEATWKDFLLGNIPHPGKFRQHIVPVDRIESASGKLSPNINRYLMRAVQIDICQGGETLFTFTKLGRFLILGFINEPNLSNWTGSKVNANQGIIEPRKYTMPAAFAGYLNEKADAMSGVTGSLSERQKEKIENSILTNIDRMKGSDFFVAMSADVEMFGTEAFHENQWRKRER